MKNSFLQVSLLAALVAGLIGCAPAVVPTRIPPMSSDTHLPTAVVLSQTSMPSSHAPAAPTLIRYIGHSSFFITAPDGTRIVTDPYGRDVPYPFPEGIEADLVTVSHAHSDHTAVGRVEGHPQIVFGFYPEALASKQVGMVSVTVFPSSHGKVQGQDMGPNTIFVFQIGEVKIVHLGEVGEIDSPETLEAIKNAEVVIAPTGIIGAMPFDALTNLLDKIGARTVLPSHYSLSAANRFYGMATVDEYLAALPAETMVVRADQLMVAPNMPRQVVVLSQWAPK
jgi:L-ascorbate metabolism protein UlaG (beta-lactamase superfamily)